MLRSYIIDNKLYCKVVLFNSLFSLTRIYIVLCKYTTYEIEPFSKMSTFQLAI